MGSDQNHHMKLFMHNNYLIYRLVAEKMSDFIFKHDLAATMQVGVD